MAGSDVFEHSLGFRKLFDRLSGDGVEAVYLDDVPALGFGVEAGAAFVVLRAFPSDLILGGDPNPDADAFGVIHYAVFHRAPPRTLPRKILCFYRKRPPQRSHYYGSHDLRARRAETSGKPHQVLTVPREDVVACPKTRPCSCNDDVACSIGLASLDSYRAPRCEYIPRLFPHTARTV
jgi:hypothetical protein